MALLFILAEKPAEKEPQLSRHYQLIKTPDGYGFSLADTFESSNGSHVITQVKIEGAAYNAGVREGKRILKELANPMDRPNFTVKLVSSWLDSFRKISVSGHNENTIKANITLANT